MKKTILILSLLATGLLATLPANPVLPGTAAKVATTFWSTNVDTKTAHQLVQVDWDYPLIYLYANPQGGYVMVAADDVAHPVLGWSPSSPISPDALPVQLRSWLHAYEVSIAAAVEARYTAPKQVADEWTSLMGGLPVKEGDDEETDDTPTFPATVSPLLTTHWDQDAPYSNLCPEGEDPWAGTRWAGLMSGPAPTGCVATAQAQLMKYWNWPPFGQGSHSYSTSDLDTDELPDDFELVDFTDLTADFAHTAYDWSNMIDSYTSSGGGFPWGGGSSTSGTAVQQHAVAELMLHVGVSVEMMYGTQMSGAFCTSPDSGYYCSEAALVDYFRYDPQTLHGIWRENIEDDNQWEQMLLTDLAAGRPVLYSGGDEDEGGHCFVCDGYDAQHRMHFNFGWGGQSDGYFALSAIQPGAGGIGGGGYNFTANQEAIFGAQPAYGNFMSDSVLYIGADGADTSALYYFDERANCIGMLQSDQDWATLSDTATGLRMSIHVEPNTSSEPRYAVITLSQCGSDVLLTLVQDGTPDPASIGTADASTFLTAYPNPTHGRLYVRAEGLQQVQVLDLGGRLLQTTTSPMVDISGLPAGVYLLRAITHQGTLTKRIVRQ